MAITAADIGNPESGLIRPGLPVLFSNGFEDSDFADWDEQVEGVSTCDQAIAAKRTGAKGLKVDNNYQITYMLKGLAITAREVELDFWLSHQATTQFGGSEWSAVASIETAPATINAVCGYGYDGSSIVPYVRIGSRSVVLSTNFTMTTSDIFRNWVLRAVFTKSYASAKFFIDGLLVASDAVTGDQSAKASDQIALGAPDISPGPFACGDYIDDFIVRGRV